MRMSITPVLFRSISKQHQAAEKENLQNWVICYSRLIDILDDHITGIGVDE